MFIMFPKMVFPEATPIIVVPGKQPNVPHRKTKTLMMGKQLPGKTGNERKSCVSGKKCEIDTQDVRVLE